MATDAKNLKICRVPTASDDAFMASTPAKGSIYFREKTKQFVVGDGTTQGGQLFTPGDQCLPLSGGTMTGEIEFSPNQKLPSGLVIGQIVESALPLTDAGLHLLDGAKLPADGMYADFYAHCQTIQASHPSLFVSESGWQSTFSTYGSCGKFVLDSDGVRLPSISNIVQGTSDVAQLGALVEAGLPNITARVGAAGAVAWQDASESFYLNGSTSPIAQNIAGSTSGNIFLRFDASRSSSIYGNSSTVQPQTIKVLLYICVANNTKSDVVVDIDRVATDLNAKLDRDLSNATGLPVARCETLSISGNAAGGSCSWLQAVRVGNVVSISGQYRPNQTGTDLTILTMGGGYVFDGRTMFSCTRYTNSDGDGAEGYTVDGESKVRFNIARANVDYKFNFVAKVKKA